MSTFEAKGLKSTLFALDRISKNTNALERRLLEEGAKDIERIARDYAPRRTGALERSIKAVEGPKGMNGRKTWLIGVDEGELGPGFSVYGFAYHIMIHDAQKYNPGHGTQQKAKTYGLPLSGPDRVGTQFLARASEQVEEQLNKALESMLKRQLRRAR